MRKTDEYHYRSFATTGPQGISAAVYVDDDNGKVFLRTRVKPSHGQTVEEEMEYNQYHEALMRAFEFVDRYAEAARERMNQAWEELKPFFAAHPEAKNLPATDHEKFYEIAREAGWGEVADRFLSAVQDYQHLSEGAFQFLAAAKEVQPRQRGEGNLIYGNKR